MTTMIIRLKLLALPDNLICDVFAPALQLNIPTAWSSPNINEGSEAILRLYRCFRFATCIPPLWLITPALL